MNCYRCLCKYDQLMHVPKLLIMCGHTLCQKCCNQLFKNGKIQCLQCRTNTFTDKVTFLPKNLALISQRTTYLKQCPKHQKKYQAFCSNEKLLICIQCILEDGHKNHEMNSITKAYQIESVNIRTKMNKIETYLDSLKQKTQQNMKIQDQSQKNYRIANQTVRQTFQLIHQLLNQQQMTILKELENSYKFNQQKFVERNKVYIETINDLSQFLNSVQNLQTLSEIDFLDQIRQKQSNLNLIKFNSYENLKILSFQHTKISILQNCIKALTTEKNPSKTSNYNSNNGQSINAHTKNQKVPFVEPIRGFKKASFSNITNNQNTKPPKKVSARKQSITHQVQVPTLKNNDKEKGLKVSNHIRLPYSSENSSEKKTIKKIDVVENINSDLSSVDPRESLCNSFLSNMTAFMGQQRSICILGGFNQENNNILKLDLINMRYQEVAVLNANRSKFGAVFADKKLYVFGGKRGKQRLNDVEMFDYQKGAWTKIGTMNKSRSGFGIVIVDDQVYLIGGNDGQNILNTVQIFNIKTKQWKKTSVMNEARDQLAVIVGNNDKIYAIGGFGGANNEPLRSIQCFDLKTKQWRLLSKMKHARRALSAAVLADGIYAVGGFDGSSYLSSVQKYDITTNQWTEISGMNVARCTHSSMAIYETQQIYVFGGFDFLPLCSVQKYSLINNEWQMISDMPSARFMHCNVLTKQTY